MDYNKADFVKINDCLSKFDWIDELKETDANNMWIKYHGIFHSIVTDHTPLRK